MNRRAFLKNSARAAGASAFLGMAGVCYGFAEASDVRVVRQTVHLPNLPEAFAGTTIAFLTDIHHGKYVNQEFIASIVRTTMTLDPDIIIHGGDYILGTSKETAPCFEVLAKLKAPMGMFGVMGNHDHYDRVSISKDCMRRAGICEMSNSGEWLSIGTSRIRIAGVDDLWKGEPDLKPAIADVKPDDACILVSHNPDFAETLTDHRVGLVLSGHTHGGQVYVPGMVNPFIPSRYGNKYSKGFVEAPATQVYVSTGLGQTGLPVRYNCPPELTLLTLAQKPEFPSSGE